MALDKNQVIKVYVNRLVNSIIPIEFGVEYIQNISNDLINYLLQNININNNIDNSQLINHFKKLFLSRGLNHEWTTFQNILDTITKFKTFEQIHNYLNYLNSIPDSNSNQLGELKSMSPASVGSNNQNLPYQDNQTEVNTTLYDLIQPYYETIPESEILLYLSYSLIGLDSKLLSFQSVDMENVSIKLPQGINNSYHSLLTNILEAGLLYKWLKNNIELKKGKISSPIKTSFLRYLELELNNYVSTINDIFYDQKNKPSSLIQIYHQLYQIILDLRILYTFTKDSTVNTGYDFLLKAFKLTKFGDSAISSKAMTIFNEVSVPYYEILEQWILKGELIDDNEEFFIKFNIEKNHINDIIEFLPNKIPNFLTSLNKSIGYKIFQIGKLLIFLNKYCKELTWVNNYNNKYSKIIFNSENQGLKSLNINIINEIINDQYQEILNYLTIVNFEKNSLFKHLENFKKIYFMNSNDFIESIIKSGQRIFNEPSNNLTSNQLSSILIESINNSAIKNYSHEFINRLDARVLDLSHGNIGWEVFTMEYKIGDLSIENILNYNQILLEYLKIFNFLWKLRHLNFLLNDNYLEFNYIWKNDLKKILEKYNRLKKLTRRNENYRLSIRDKKILWLIKSFKVINLIRSQLINFMNNLIEFFSFDIIETNFEKLIVEKLFKSSNPIKSRENKGNNMKNDTNNYNDRPLPILNKLFLQSIESENIVGLGEREFIKNNMNELTIDELVEIHETYLSSIINCKLFNDSSIGKNSGMTFIKLIYAILEVIFKFIKGSEEFSLLLTDYISVMNIEEAYIDDDDDQMSIANENEREDNDDFLESVEDKLKVMINKLYNEVYLQDFKNYRELFIRDLKNDLDLKNLSKCI